MPRNPGNTGHRGYKMSIVTSITTEGDQVKATLACGHVQYWQPGHGHTAESWAAYIQQGFNPFVVGKTRLRCEETHEQEKS